MINPLLQEWDTPFSSPPFNLIEISHFKPAVEEAIKSALKEINAITENPEKPDFMNTIAALDKAGNKLDDVTSILFNLNSAETNKDLQAVAEEVSPLLTRFSNDITLNEKLFKRVKTVYDIRDTAGLNTEEKMLLEKNYRHFIL
jgi:Zn-dependent oligopeptidase